MKSWWGMEELTLKPPIVHSYWVLPGQLLAGEYPRDPHPESSRKKLQSLLDAGITRFVDLTAPADMLEPYQEILEALVPGREVARHHFPIRDQSIPDTPGQMKAILDFIDEAVANGEKVYVHCWGGIGRTGTVVGCWLARHGGAETAAARLAALWQACGKSARRVSPETPGQLAYIQHWQESSV